MATIRPFRAVRPNTSVADRVAALPYDVYNRSEAKTETEREPLSFLCIDRAETQFDDSVDIYADEVYKKADELYHARKADGTFIMEEKPCYYIYELTMDSRSQTGIVGCASVDDYMNNIIKKHENTRADKEADRIRHVDSLSAQTGPIFLAYKAREDINKIIAKVKRTPALYDFASPDGIIHRAWIIDNDDDMDVIRKAFEATDSIYIADGHHRCASAVRVGTMRRRKYSEYTGAEEFNYFLSVLFADEELMIMDYNRVVKDLNNYTAAEILAELSKLGKVTEIGNKAYKPEHKGEVGVFLENTWYKFEYADNLKSDDPVDGLDVAILQNNVLKPIFGIEDPKTDKRIDFVGGIRGLGELERRVHSDCRIAFAMYATGIDELFKVADAGLLMPPKSTWFEPKLRSGLFIHEIER